MLEQHKEMLFVSTLTLQGAMNVMDINRKHDIVQRAFDQKWMVWSMVDSPFADLDWHRKSGLPVPQCWVPIYVAHTEEEAKRASKRSRV